MLVLPALWPLPKPLSLHQTLWIAYSGGMDSTVLLHHASQLQAQGVTVKAIHVNHGLQPQAQEWQEHCLQTAHALGVSCVAKTINTQPNPGDSVEAWARAERRACFQSVMAPGDCLVTAQHADDQAETVLLQLLRGAGPAGLSGMPVLASFGVGFQWRPWLKVAQATLRAYATQHSLQWREDPSNQDLRFARNFIRHRVMPVLTERWPQASTVIGRAAQNCAEMNSTHQRYLETLLPPMLAADGTLILSALFEHDTVLQGQLLRSWWQKATGQHLSREQVETIMREVIGARRDAHPLLYLHGWELRRVKMRLYAVPSYTVSRSKLDEVHEPAAETQQ